MTPFHQGTPSYIKKVLGGGGGGFKPRMLMHLLVVEGRMEIVLSLKRGIIMHVQPPVSQVVRLASRLSSETPALGKDRQGMFVE